MFIRRAFIEFLTLQSEATPAVTTFYWVIDWRWFEE